MDEVGNIVVESTLDSAGFDAGAAKLENRMKKAAQNVDKATRKVEELQRELQRLKANGAFEKSEKGFISAETAGQIVQVKTRLAEAQTRLEGYTIQQREASAALEQYNINARESVPTMSQVSSQVDRFRKRLVGLAKRVFIFSMITKALRAMRSALMGTIGADRQMSASLAQIKGNLISAFAPIYYYVLPAIRTLLSWLAKLTAYFAAFMNGLFGKTAKQADRSAAALYNQAFATEAAGSAAEKAEKQLASFDTINKLSSNSDSGGGGGGGGEGGGIAPEFSLDDQLGGKAEKIKRIAQKLAPYIKAVAAGFAAWKIASKLFSDMNKVWGIALVIAGAILMIHSAIDMVKNGISWDNLTEYIIGATALVVGLGIAFGPVVAAVGLIAAGIALFAIGVRDVVKKGFNKKNLTAITVGLLAIGGAIALLTGSWIPLLIAAVAAAIAWIVANWKEVKAFFKKLTDNIKRFFSDLWANVKTGAKTGFTNLTNAFKSAHQWFKTNVVDKVAKAFSDAWNKVTSGAKQAYNGVINAFKSIPAWFRDTFTQAWTNVKNVFSTGGKIFDGIKDGIASTFKTVVNKIISGINTVIAIPFNKINGMLNDIRNAHFLGISPFKNMWSQDPLSVPQIPALARGAVIPGGRAFLATLGDQPRGQTNIETPLDTMVEAFRRAGAGRQQIIIKIGDKEFKRFVYDSYNTEANRHGKPLFGGAV